MRKLLALLFFIAIYHPISAQDLGYEDLIEYKTDAELKSEAFAKFEPKLSTRMISGIVELIKGGGPIWIPDVLQERIQQPAYVHSAPFVHNRRGKYVWRGLTSEGFVALDHIWQSEILARYYMKFVESSHGKMDPFLFYEPLRWDPEKKRLVLWHKVKVNSDTAKKLTAKQALEREVAISMSSAFIKQYKRFGAEISSLIPSRERLDKIVYNGPMELYNYAPVHNRNGSKTILMVTNKGKATDLFTYYKKDGKTTILDTIRVEAGVFAKTIEYTQDVLKSDVLQLASSDYEDLYILTGYQEKPPVYSTSTTDTNAMNSVFARGGSEDTEEQINYRTYVIRNSANYPCTVKFWLVGGTTTPVYEKLGVNGMEIPANGKKEFLVSYGTKSVSLKYDCPESNISGYWK